MKLSERYHSSSRTGSSDQHDAREKLSIASRLDDRQSDLTQIPGNHQVAPQHKRDPRSYGIRPIRVHYRPVRGCGLLRRNPDDWRLVGLIANPVQIWVQNYDFIWAKRRLF